MSLNSGFIGNHHLGRIEKAINLLELHIHQLHHSWQAFLPSRQRLADTKAACHACIKNRFEL